MIRQNRQPVLYAFGKFLNSLLVIQNFTIAGKGGHIVPALRAMVKFWKINESSNLWTICCQVIIFVKSVQRCMALSGLLTEQNFPAICIHRSMPQEER